MLSFESLSQRKSSQKHIRTTDQYSDFQTDSMLNVRVDLVFPLIQTQRSDQMLHVSITQYAFVTKDSVEMDSTVAMQTSVPHQLISAIFLQTVLILLVPTDVTVQQGFSLMIILVLMSMSVRKSYIAVMRMPHA